MKKMTWLIPILIVFGFLLYSSVFIVYQINQAIVLQFGELVSVHTKPGLKFKIPFIQEVMFYDNRYLSYDLPKTPVTTADQKRVEVDTYTRYSISNPGLFFQSIKPPTELGAQMRLEAIVNSTLRNVLGKIQLRQLLSEERSKIMRHIQEEVRRQTVSLGISILDVRIIRTELPPENQQAVFARMNSELDRIAKQNRANGAEKAQTIKAKTARERVEILSTAQKEAEIIRGTGEAESIVIATSALAEDPQFYEFTQSLDIYQKSFDENTTLILNFDNDLFRFLKYFDK